MITVYLTCRFRKFNLIAICISYSTLNPLTRKLLSPSPRLENPSCIFVAICRGPWSPNAASLPLTSRAAPVDGLPVTTSPFPPYTPNTAPLISTSTCMISPRLSSAACTPPLTGCQLLTGTADHSDRLPDILLQAH